MIQAAAIRVAKLPATPHAVNLSAGEKNTSKGREDVAQAMNSEMLVCKTTAFLEDYGPFPAAARANVDKSKDYLRGLGLLRGNGWTGFSILPSESQKTEPEAFAPLEQIVKGIWEYVKEEERRNGNPYDFKMVPHEHLDDSIGGSDHKMDACIIEATYNEKLPNNLIVVPVGLKTVWKKAEQRQFREQVWETVARFCVKIPAGCSSSGYDYYSSDFLVSDLLPQVTFEDNLFSVWYFSRSHSVKTLAFNWTGDGIDDFIRVILAFAYASPQELGIDPHVFKASRLTSDEGQQYVYEFEVPEDSAKPLPIPIGLNTRTSSSENPHKGHMKVYYRTVRARVPMRPVCISGRTTRIWEVVQVASVTALPDDDAEHVILKDVWLNANPTTEAENQTRIFEAVDDYVERGLAAHPGPNGMMDFINSEARFRDFNDNTKSRLAGLLTDKEYQSLFLTKILEWKGELTGKRSDAANRPLVPLFTLASAKGKKVDNNRDSQGGLNNLVIAQTEVTSVVSQAPAVVARRRQYDQEQQVRFIYKEVCTEIYKLPTFGDVIDVTRQGLDALQILYCAGWVHRDISTGNILAVPVINETGETTGWKVKLADLEFSQKLGHSTNKTDPRTGTPFFMPVEIMKREYLAMQFRAPQAMRPFATLAGHFKLQPDHPDYKHYLKYRKNNIMAAFKQPPADAIAEKNWPDYVTHIYQHDLESIWWMILYFITACADEKESEEYARTIFLRKMKATPREAVLEHFIDSVLENKLHDLLKGPFQGPMESLRAMMHEHYIKRVIFGQIDVHESYSCVHGQFAEQLDLILEDEDDEWKSLPFSKMVQAATTMDIPSLPFGSTKHGREEDAGSVTGKLNRIRFG